MNFLIVILIYSDMNDYFNELSLSNYWNGRLPEAGFIRKSYTNRILAISVIN